MTVTAVTRSARRTSKRHARPAWKKLLIPLVVMVALFLLWRYTPIADEFDARHVVQWAREVARSPWSPVVLIAAYIVAAFTLFPRPLITLIVIIAYGPWLGFTIAMTGIVVSALAIYCAGRALPPQTLAHLGGKNLDRAGEALRKHGLTAAIAVSIVPIAPFPLIGMTAGAVRISVWKFLAGVSIGMLPGVLTTTIFTDQVLAALDDEAEVNYWMLAGVVVVLAALIFFVRRWFVKQR